MEHFIVVTDPIDGVNFAQAPPAERTDACYMGYGPAMEAIAEVHAQRTFDWATDDAGVWADGTQQDHQVWHIVDGVVTEYMMVSY